MSKLLGGLYQLIGDTMVGDAIVAIAVIVIHDMA